jgi:hypothetical protein
MGQWKEVIDYKCVRAHTHAYVYLCARVCGCLYVRLSVSSIY